MIEHQANPAVVASNRVCPRYDPIQDVVNVPSVTMACTRGCHRILRHQAPSFVVTSDRENRLEKYLFGRLTRIYSVALPALAIGLALYPFVDAVDINGIIYIRQGPDGRHSVSEVAGEVFCFFFSKKKAFLAMPWAVAPRSARR